MAVDLCPNCARPLALYASHGCGEHADQCGARDAGCWDCVYECNQATIHAIRVDLERYQRKFGALRAGLCEPKNQRGKAHRQYGVYR